MLPWILTTLEVVDIALDDSTARAGTRYLRNVNVTFVGGFL